MHLYLYFNEKNLKPCKMFNHCSRLIHDREMKNILCARFQSTVSPSYEAQNARTQCRNEMHSMAAVNEQKFGPRYHASGIFNVTVILYY